jgi:hypothetical protein
VDGNLRRLGLFGLLARWSEIGSLPWVAQLLDFEETERRKRSLERRLRYAKIGVFRPMDRFDWSWPRRIDRGAIEELFGCISTMGTGERSRRDLHPGDVGALET